MSEVAAAPDQLLPSKPAPKLKLNKKVQVILVCLLFSILCWFLIALSKEYVAHVKFKLKYEAIPVNYVIENELPQSVRLAVKASGFRILSYRISRSYDPVSIEVSSKLPRTSRIPSEVALPAKALDVDFLPIMGDEFQILQYSPDTIFFSFRDTTQKKTGRK